MPNPFDALVVLSFGGPEGPDDVMPFLRNVTRGRGVPDERLADVAEHYLHFGGVSPINRLNRELIGRIEAELKLANLDLPVYFANRNWHPMIEQTVAQMAADGIRNALVLPTSAWGGYSGCRQYHEDIARGRASVGSQAPELTKLRQFYNHPLFVASVADSIVAACDSLPRELQPDARIVFTAHSIPVSADRTAGPTSAGGFIYSRQIHAAAAEAAKQAGVTDYDVVWQSRSGPAQVLWLEPDISDHLLALIERDVRAVVVCPIGFVSDHMEVVWDLDHEAADLAAEHGVAFARAATVGTDPRFSQMVVSLVQEQLSGSADASGLGSATNGQLCAEQCCTSAPRPS